MAQEERDPTAIFVGTADTIDSIDRQHHTTELDHLVRIQATTEHLETGCPEVQVRTTKEKEAVIHQMHHPIAAVLVKIPAIEFQRTKVLIELPQGQSKRKVFSATVVANMGITGQSVPTPVIKGRAEPRRQPAPIEETDVEDRLDPLEIGGCPIK